MVQSGRADVGALGPAGERLRLACYTLGADRTGYPPHPGDLSLCALGPGTIPEARRRNLCLVPPPTVPVVGECWRDSLSSRVGCGDALLGTLAVRHRVREQRGFWQA
jgi:hypothetical protein